jgi:hypothetical protein
MNRIFLIGAAALGLSVTATQALACNPYIHSPGFSASFAKGPVPGVQTDAPPPVGVNNATTRTIVGLWHTIHSDDSGNPFLETLDQWHADGTELEYANIPPTFGPTCLGVWTAVNHGAQLYHTTFFYDANGNFTGTMQLRARYKVSKDGMSYTGPFDEKDYDPNGALMKETKGTVTGTRIVSTQ